jgi:hypothetical protein
VPVPSPAAVMTGPHPHLRLVSVPDPLDRRASFEAAHPDVTIVPPGNRLNGRWRAVVPAGMIPGDPTATTLGSWQLSGLMDQLDEIYPPGG